jgi:antirestriction protein ArdC
MKNNKVYKVIVDRILKTIEDGGLAPWQKPWHATAGGELPRNLVSKKPYRGINLLLLSCCGASYNSPYWLSFKQCSNLGGKVRKGEHSFPIIFWTFLEDKDEDGNPVLDAHGRPKKHVLIRYYNVFNTDQCEGLEGKVPEPVVVEKPKFTPIESGRKIIDKYLKDQKAAGHTLGYVERGDRAFYSPAIDAVTVPEPAAFNKPVNFYATVFHELGHSTGHKDRLSRKGVTETEGFGSEPYAKEELIAELTASFLCGVAGFEEEIEKNSAAYLKGWLEAIKAAPELLVESAQAAHKAADYVLNEEG